MDEKTEELITRFKESNSYYYKAGEMDIRKLVSSSEFQNDLSSLLFFLKSPPNVHDYGSSVSPGTLYIELCSNYIFPALSQKINSSVAQAVCDAFIDDKGYASYEQFTKPAWSLLKKTGDMANDGLCRLVVSRSSMPYSCWGQAVQLLESNQCKEAVPSIIMGISNGYDGWKAWKDKNLTIGIRAIITLATDNIEAVLDILLQQQDSTLRALIIKELSIFGDRRILLYLNEHIPTFLGKDSGAYVRNLLNSSSERIKERNIKEGLEIEKHQKMPSEPCESVILDNLSTGDKAVVLDLASRANKGSSAVAAHSAMPAVSTSTPKLVQPDVVMPVTRVETREPVGKRKFSLIWVLTGLVVIFGIVISGLAVIKVLSPTPTKVFTATVTSTMPMATSTPMSTPVTGAPIVQRVVLRKDTSTGQEIIYQDVYFTDNEGDVFRWDFDVVSSTNPDVTAEGGSLDIPSSEQKSGAVATGEWGCGGGSYTVTLAVTFTDLYRHSSAPYEYVMTCGE
jgi:hypothetical protein